MFHWKTAATAPRLKTRDFSNALPEDVPRAKASCDQKAIVERNDFDTFSYQQVALKCLPLNM